MARQPADVVAATKWPQGREPVWSAIRKLRNFTLTELWDAVEREINRDTIKSYLRGLVAGGYVETSKAPPGRAKFYALVRDVGVEAPRVRQDGSEVTQGAGQANMWRSMRLLGTFSPKDLAIAATTRKTAVSEVEAKHYCKHLRKAGYLSLLSAGKPTSQAVYRFVKLRYSGPKAPMIQRVKCVFDPNVGEVVWPKGWAHE